MTWRAFLIGLLAVIVIAAITPYNDIVARSTYITGNHFPAGAFFILLLLVVGVNVVLKRLRRSWALRHTELMLVWCMMIVASTVPGSGLMRYWFNVLAAPSYYGQRADLQYSQDVLPLAPAGLVLSKYPASVAAKRFFEGARAGEELRVPWDYWARPLAVWSAFILLYYLATFFLTGILRKQWVDVERLIFPLARVPMDLTEGSEGEGLLPALVRNRAFQIGLAASLTFGLWRAGPSLLGSATPWSPTFWVQALLNGTPLEAAQIGGIFMAPMAIGFAFLVPADVALSVWLFFLFSRVELLAASWMGVPIAGGTFSPFMAWQQAGAFIIFTLMMLWAARRHLTDVVRKAFTASPRIDDASEPISYRVGFWGLMASVAGMVAWYVWFTCPALHGPGRDWGAALDEVATTVPVVLVLLALTFSVVLVHARLIAQGGIFFTQQTWQPPQFLHGVTQGTVFSPQMAIAAQMQNAILIQDAREILSGHAVNALRVASVFDKHRRLFLPIMMFSLIVAMAVSGHAIMDIYYSKGSLNTTDTYASQALPQDAFTMAHKMISNPTKAVPPQYGALTLGAVVMFAVTVMRLRFYWWPVHSLGFLMASTWPAQILWFPFFLGWLTKVGVLKFGGGGVLRKVRSFWLGVIVGEATLVGMSAVLGLAGVKVGNLFLPG
jgi:hypothetical protein